MAPIIDGIGDLIGGVGKVAGSRVTTGEISQDSLARVIRDGTVIFTGKIGFNAKRWPSWEGTPRKNK